MPLFEFREHGKDFAAREIFHDDNIESSKRQDWSFLQSSPEGTLLGTKIVRNCARFSFEGSNPMIELENIAELQELK